MASLREPHPRQISFVRVHGLDGEVWHAIFQGASMTPIQIGSIEHKGRGVWLMVIGGPAHQNAYKAMTDKRAYRHLMGGCRTFRTLKAAQQAVLDAREAAVKKKVQNNARVEA